MPRWRRPSLRAAREAKGTDLRAMEAQRLTFSHTEYAVSHGLERRRLRYRMVRLSDAPDEIRSAELALLDQGDEVELLQQSGQYWQVSTPTGLVGWVHRMTLGDVVAAPAAPAPPTVAAADARGGRRGWCGRRRAGGRADRTGRSGPLQRRAGPAPRPRAVHPLTSHARSTSTCWWTMLGTKLRG